MGRAMFTMNKSTTIAVLSSMATAFFIGMCAIFWSDKELSKNEELELFEEFISSSNIEEIRIYPYRVEGSNTITDDDFNRIDNYYMYKLDKEEIDIFKKAIFTSFVHGDHGPRYNSLYLIQIISGPNIVNLYYCKDHTLDWKTKCYGENYEKKYGDCGEIRLIKSSISYNTKLSEYHMIDIVFANTELLPLFQKIEKEILTNGSKYYVK